MLEPHCVGDVCFHVGGQKIEVEGDAVGEAPRQKGEELVDLVLPACVLARPGDRGCCASCSERAPRPRVTVVKSNLGGDPLRPHPEVRLLEPIHGRMVALGVGSQQREAKHVRVGARSLQASIHDDASHGCSRPEARCSVVIDTPRCIEKRRGACPILEGGVRPERPELEVGLSHRRCRSHLHLPPGVGSSSIPSPRHAVLRVWTAWDGRRRRH